MMQNVMYMIIVGGGDVEVIVAALLGSSGCEALESRGLQGAEALQAPSFQSRVCATLMMRPNYVYFPVGYEVGLTTLVWLYVSLI